MATACGARNEDSGDGRRRIHRIIHRDCDFLGRGDEVVGLDNLNDYYDVNLKRARLARLEAMPRSGS